MYIDFYFFYLSLEYYQVHSLPIYGNIQYCLNPTFQDQRWKKVAAAAASRVKIFHSCANFFHVLFIKVLAIFVQFLAFLLIFA